MAEADTDTAVVDPPAEDTGTPAPVAILDDKGAFVEKWQQALPEEIRAEPTFRKYKTIQDMASGLLNAQKMIGKGKVAIPTETSTAGEIEEFFRAAGRPETAADYGIKVPDVIPEEYRDTKIVEAFQTLAYKIGLSKKQALAIAEFQNNNVLSGLANMKSEKDATMAELKDGLTKEWGAAYNEKVSLGNVAIEQGTAGNEELKERIVAKLGNDPDFIRFAANLGAKFAEHGVKGEPTPTPGDIKEKIADLMATDAYRVGTHPQHKAMVEKVQKLFQQTHA